MAFRMKTKKIILAVARAKKTLDMIPQPWADPIIIAVPEKKIAATICKIAENRSFRSSLTLKSVCGFSFSGSTGIPNSIKGGGE